MNQTLIVAVSGMLLIGPPIFADGDTYIAFDVLCSATTPASACPAGLAPGQVAAQSSARGINARNEIVGMYVDGTGKQHGFLLRDRQYTSLDFPVTGVRATIANGINARSEIVGQYTVPVNTDPTVPEESPLYCPTAADPACIKGFYYWEGRFSTVMFPPTVDANKVEHKHPGAIAQRISDDGDVYGCLHDHDLGPSMSGAVWRRFDTISLTDNGGELIDPMGVPMSMNNGGTPGRAKTIVGLYADMVGVQHGFVVQDGRLTNYDPDGANLTAIWDINREHQYAGTYRRTGEPSTQRHGFVQDPPESEHAVPPPAHTLDVQVRDTTNKIVTAFATLAYGISPSGLVVGQYTLVSGGPVHAFLAIPPHRERHDREGFDHHSIRLPDADRGEHR